MKKYFYEIWLTQIFKFYLKACFAKCYQSYKLRISLMKNKIEIQ